ncbi:Max-like protein X [Halotydeus destructor]|nr:Max-like protein X [Halotydeus destructor]
MYSPSFTRTSSTGSIDLLSPGSSAQNTDDGSVTTDEEDSDNKSTVTYKERRREAHTQAEQKRRDAIKRGYEDLQHLVPTCQQQDSVSSYKLSKATILQRSIDYIQFLQQQRKKQDDDLQSLRKEVVALQIMKSNYEQMVKQHQQSQPGQSTNQISEDVKLQVFEAMCDRLFLSFDESVSATNFQDLSSCMITWLEENCKPQTLKQVAGSVLGHISNK